MLCRVMLSGHVLICLVFCLVVSCLVLSVRLFCLPDVCLLCLASVWMCFPAGLGLLTSRAESGVCLDHLQLPDSFHLLVLVLVVVF
jgi:hypothetical protein